MQEDLILNTHDPKERFDFGKNWMSFLKKLSDSRVKNAEEQMKKFLGKDHLQDKIFIDAGSGSGLMSLAANNLGAEVYSFDYDIDSVRCTENLKKLKNAHNWSVSEGSLLDTTFLKKLPRADIVYCWGVAHHTGDMWTALENLSNLVKPGGILFLSIYNDQGIDSVKWLKRKKRYNSIKKIPLIRGIYLFTMLLFPLNELKIFLSHLRNFKLRLYLRDFWTEYQRQRGMSRWHDLVDWVGGLPFEVAKPEEVFEFFKAKGFLLEKLKTCAGGIGCNEYLFKAILK